VVLGSGSRAEVELNLDACRAARAPIVRRRGGGCAVVLDPGNIIVSVVATGLPFGRHREHFDALTDWLTAGLADIGFPGVHQAGICDLVAGDRKVGGACLHRRRGLLYYSASLLACPDLVTVARLLKHPPREPGYRRGRNHAAFMGSLAAAVDVGSGNGNSTRRVAALSADQVATRLRRALRPPVLLHP
jgi:lipoate-protein ligase A